MKEKICVNIGEDHAFICDKKTLARSGENEVTQIEIKFADCLCDSWAYIDFVKPYGSKFKTPKLDIVNNIATYDIPNSLLDKEGTLKAQIVLQNESGEIWKSEVLCFNVAKSINATDEIEGKEDFITDAQNLLNEIENGLTPTIGENDNWFVGGKDTGKSSKGGKGDKGDKGDAGAVKLLVVNELPTENIEADAIYLKPSESQEEENVYNEYVYANGNWEKLSGGGASVDLTGYATEEYVDSKVSEPVYDVVITSNYAAPDLSVNTTSKVTLTNDLQQWKNIQDKIANQEIKSVLVKFTNYYCFFDYVSTSGVRHTYSSTKIYIGGASTALPCVNALILKLNKSGDNITSVTVDLINFDQKYLSKKNNSMFIPSENYQPSTKLYTDKTHYENMAGYDAAKTQVLKNINGTLTWVDE